MRPGVCRDAFVGKVPNKKEEVNLDPQYPCNKLGVATVPVIPAQVR